MVLWVIHLVYMDHVLPHYCASVSNLPWRGGKLHAGKSESALEVLCGCITAPGEVTGVRPQQGLQPGYGPSQMPLLLQQGQQPVNPCIPGSPQQLSLCSRAQTAVMSCWIGRASPPSAVVPLSLARWATRVSWALRRGLCPGRCYRVGP